MKAFISKIIFTLLMQGFANSLFAHVELDYPVGGETFTVGQTITIQWHIAIAHNTLNWDLLFSSDGGATWEFIQMDLPASTLSYTWLVPSTITSQARVSVIQDNSGTDYQDESMNFIIVLPPIPPVIILGAMDTIIESNVTNQNDAIQTWLDNHGGASATGVCGNLNWTDDYISLGNGCGVTGSAEVTFTATDDCGSTETVASVTVADTSPPMIGNPASDLAVECDGNGNTSQLNAWIQNRAGASASDAGGNVTWTNNFSTLSNSCGSTGNATVIFTATDECGNSMTTSATFTIEDHLAPAIELAAQDTTIGCGLPNTQSILQNWLLNSGGAIATDVCGSVAWSNDFPVVVDTCQASTIVPVTFTAIDDCGNSTVTTAIVNLMGPLGITAPGLSESEFKISPNPVTDLLKVELDIDLSLIERITLFDALGHPVVVFKQRSRQMNIPVQELSPGLYYLQVETSHGVGSRKVVIE